MIGQRDLERGINCFRAGIAEENMVEIAGSQWRYGSPARKPWVRELERRRVVERRRFALDGDKSARGCARHCAPGACRAIDELAPVAGAIMHILGADDEPRPFLECAVGRERHPVGFEVIGDRRRCQSHVMPRFLRAAVDGCFDHCIIPFRP
jgi:hypothetical protein